MKFLVVDDNVDLVDMIATHLRAQGHEVSVALDGTTALLAIEKHQVDAVLLDLALPDLTGYEVARRLRDGLLRRDAVIALFTGEATLSFDSATSVGIDLVLRKPLEPEELRRMLTFVHDRRRRQLESIV